ALIVTIIFVPSMPVKSHLSYGTQLSILKEKNVWMAIIAVVFLNGGIFGVYSYLADYLERVTNYSAEIISIALLVYGLANI
ncbi:MFS transporter, partial [Fusobacterium mortiferum]|nr:MFS transporter [Fusobacterium mortiferum]